MKIIVSSLRRLGTLMEYEERYCAFVDILGFSELVAGLRDDPSKFEIIRSLLRKIREPDDPNIFSDGGNDFKAQSISDAVAFSTKPTVQGLSILLAKLRELSVGLLAQGFFVRGAVCKGLLYQDEQMVFGEALINAHKLESTVAKYPRIMIARDVVEDALASEERGNFVEHINQAEDGPYYLHVLWRIGMVLENLKQNPEHKGSELNLEYYAKVRHQIELTFAASVDTPSHFEKVKWFANYWNETVDSVGGSVVMHIDGAGLKWHLPPSDDSRI